MLGNAAQSVQPGLDFAGEVIGHGGNEHDPVPCPCCGWLQKVMIRFAKKQLHRWMTKAGLVGLMAGIAGFSFANGGGELRPPVDATMHFVWVLSVLVLAASVGMLAGREVWGFFHQPNRLPKKVRIRLGNRRSNLIRAGEVAPPRKATKSRKTAANSAW